MNLRLGRARPVLFGIAGVGVVLGGGYGLIRKQFPQHFADNSVYHVSYGKPAGWKEDIPGPFTLFIYREPHGHATMRASVNEIQSRVNPTPELDTNGIAEYYIELTGDNMPNWKAERMADVKTDAENFSLIRRSKEDRTVYTAFCAKGNTTVVVSLTAGGKEAPGLEKYLPDLKSVLGTIRLTKKHIVIND